MELFLTAHLYMLNSFENVLQFSFYKQKSSEHHTLIVQSCFVGQNTSSVYDSFVMT